MIQRIQSLWLFLAALANGLLFLFPLLKYHILAGTIITEKVESAGNYYPLLVIAVVITLLPLVTIFRFQNRKAQRGMTMVGILGTISFQTMLLTHAANLKNATPPATDMQYLIPGSILPVVAIVLLIMALFGIRKDEKLIKSLDRLR